ncbi:MAG: response regulator transcription factor [Dyadobacter sp.]|uniref:response regulator n=1 Tax=Dyadobacter sp. TaxID=1914288 RepID=UPI001B1107EA|nr:response regulator transcription factor [Dyadobacter sp.]MBO9611282.1 response regulator transcription factor [Dyadobacter sp.]
MHHILIVDDHPMMAIGLQSIAKTVIENSTFTLAYTFTEGLDALAKQPADLLILDLAIPGTRGPEMIDSYRAVQQDVRILVCSGRDELMNAPICLHRGANGFLHKNSFDGEAVTAIRAVMENKKYISTKVKDAMLSNLMEGKAMQTDPAASLTPREREVLGLLLTGKWLKAIAEELNVKISTVGTQKNRIFKKMKVDNIIDLAKKFWYLEEKTADHL